MTDQPTKPKPKRRWYQFSLRSLLVFMLVSSVGLGWVVPRILQAIQEERVAAEIKNLGGYVYCDMWSIKSVRSVQLSRTPVTDAWLERLKKLSQLEVLQIIRTPISDAGLEHLQGQTHLQYLYLGETAITDSGLQHLAELSQLHLLSLNDTKVTDAGLEHLKGLSQLQVLWLKGTQVTDDGVQKLQNALPNCKVFR